MINLRLPFALAKPFALANKFDNLKYCKFQYDPETNEWLLLPIKLKKGVFSPAAFILDENEIQC